MTLIFLHVKNFYIENFDFWKLCNETIFLTQKKMLTVWAQTYVHTASQASSRSTHTHGQAHTHTHTSDTEKIASTKWYYHKPQTRKCQTRKTLDTTHTGHDKSQTLFIKYKPNPRHNKHQLYILCYDMSYVCYVQR